MTSIRVRPGAGQSLAEARDLYAQRLRAAADPLALGLAVIDVRAQGLEASRGATDFGEYFVYFSFFIVVSALLLVALFFKLGIEQRVREVGLLRAVGFGPRPRAMAVSAGRRAARRRRQRARHRRRTGLRVADDVRAAIVVGRCGRDDGAHAARVAGVARRRGGRRSARRGCLHLVDAARVEAHLRAQPADGDVSTTPQLLQLPTPNGIRSRAGSGRSRRRRWRSLAVLLLAGAATGAVERVGAFFGAGSALLAGLAVRERRGCFGVGRAAASTATGGCRCRGLGCGRRPIDPAAACCRLP